MEAGTGAPPSYTLAVTKRCLIVDLGLSEADLERPLAELRDSSLVIQQFIDQRSQLPIGQETVQGLQAPIVAYSLHAGADRALTWHDRESGLVWLLASRFHRSGQAEDSYPFFRSRRREQLLPTRDDYTRAFEAQARTFAQALMEDVPPLLASAFLQADATADHIAAEVSGRPFRAPFDSMSMCIMEMFDKAAFAQVPVELTGDPDRPVRVRPDAGDDYKVGVSPVSSVIKFRSRPSST